MGAGRVIATASTEEKRGACARAGRRRRRSTPTPEGLAERLREANGGQRRSTSSSRWPAAQVFDESFAALAPFGRIVAYGIATREQNEVRTGKLLRTLARGRRLLASTTCSSAPAGPTRRWPTSSRAPPAASCASWSAGPGRWPQAAEAQIALAERRTTGKLLLDPQRLA